MYAKHYENPTMLSRVTAKNVGDVFFETHCTVYIWCSKRRCIVRCGRSWVRIIDRCGKREAPSE